MHLGRVNISSDYLSILAAAQCILLLLRWVGGWAGGRVGGFGA